MLQISQRALDELRAHAEQAYPEECCGVLLGRTERCVRVVNEVVRCPNPHQSPRTRYSIDPRDLVRLQRAARERRLQILGFYHSHPDHAAQPSPGDLAEAYWTGCSYVITAVEQGRATVTNSFLLTGSGEQRRFEDEHFVVLA